MNIILAADGNVGSATAREMLAKQQPVIVLLHSDTHAEKWKRAGAGIVIGDINDSGALTELLKRGDRAFLLNPPAPPSTDTVAVEKASVASIVEAVGSSGIRKVVAASTYGAQRGDGIGDLGVLFDMEEGLKDLKIDTTIIRSAYYMSNWEMSLEPAQQEGMVYSFFPPDFQLPMVSPEDIGRFAAEFMLRPIEAGTRYEHVEGPEEYSSRDVAAAFAAALGRDVSVSEIPQAKWKATMEEFGFSSKAAASMAAMTKVTLEHLYRPSSVPNRGVVPLMEYISKMVSNTRK